MRDAPIAVVVDDNQVVAQLLGEVCVEQGYQAIVFCNAWQALDELLTTRPDVIILDIHMPGITGNDLLRRLGSPPYSLDSIPIAITTGDPNWEIDESCRSLDVSVFLKPKGIREIGPFLIEVRQRSRVQ